MQSKHWWIVVLIGILLLLAGIAAYFIHERREAQARYERALAEQEAIRIERVILAEEMETPQLEKPKRREL